MLLVLKDVTLLYDAFVDMGGGGTRSTRQEGRSGGKGHGGTSRKCSPRRSRPRKGGEHDSKRGNSVSSTGHSSGGEER